MFVLAQLSDPHLPMPRPRLRELTAKRILGLVNWHVLRRSAHHDAATLAALIDDLKAQRPDHIAVLGDLVNLSLPDEFPPAARFLAALGAPEDVTLVPGNHDSYVAAERATHLAAWRENLLGDDASDATLADAFPFVRRRGPVALIGVSTALPTLPFLSTGRVGKDQLDRLARILAALGRERAFRVVLIHHPPAGRRAPHKVLTDAVAFRAAIAAHGAEIVLHGHDHRASSLALEGPEGPVPLIGVPSASSPAANRRPAAYNLFHVNGSPGDWRCEMETRGVGTDGRVAALGRQVLLGKPAGAVTRAAAAP
jgi:3',5'-cyclic AMP phosphodiesterase CpdA